MAFVMLQFIWSEGRPAKNVQELEEWVGANEETMIPATSDNMRHHQLVLQEML